jgi:hypothetical protein
MKSYDETPWWCQLLWPWFGPAVVRADRGSGCLLGRDRPAVRPAGRRTGRRPGPRRPVSATALEPKAGQVKEDGEVVAAARAQQPAKLVVTNRVGVMQNSRCSGTASSAITRPRTPLASPTVTRAGRAGWPAARRRLSRSAVRCERAGTQRIQGHRGGIQGAVEVRRRAAAGSASPNASTVNTTVVRSTDTLWPRSVARPARVTTEAAAIVQRMKAILAWIDGRSALRSKRSSAGRGAEP